MRMIPALRHNLSIFQIQKTTESNAAYFHKINTLKINGGFIDKLSIFSLQLTCNYVGTLNQ